jgi:hypothetical protein
MSITAKYRKKVPRRLPHRSSVSIRYLKTLRVIDGGTRWKYEFSASLTQEHDAGEKDEEENEGILYVSAVSSKPPGRSTVGALPVTPIDLWKPHEVWVGQSLEKATGLKAQKGKLPSTFTEGVLLKEPTIGEVPGLIKKPDYLLFQGGQIEVFEATLDARFEKGRKKKPDSSVSHKRLQLAGNVELLSQLYPDVPIIYNIRVNEGAPQKVKDELANELWSIRRRLAAKNLKNPVQIIWRS